jgi:hypothetical protein
MAKGLCYGRATGSIEGLGISPAARSEVIKKEVRRESVQQNRQETEEYCLKIQEIEKKAVVI